ncbi:phage baseplate assembly protein V [Pseudomonas kurunegalensis]|uniref:phage baseplate assembly protein V n=1 Tax=Pseudomonas kurunegalensis TaxID=485880 RepID=UPI00257113FE|nr:phage baseplate assembly protein V [Pseudomonas kurunegalensis]WJD63100.1 phage baseplate assembly protein V [Pseudomonas kurunegalensis]
MEDAIRRCVERMFPELSGGYHLPRFAQVVGVADAPAGAGICDEFRPRFAVDLQVLDQDNEPDQSMPVLAGVPVPVPTGGDEMGFYSFPEEGTKVVVSFAQGLPHKPFIQCILPHGLSLPSLPKGDQVWQHSEASQQRVEANGDWTRQTDGRIRDKATERVVESLSNTEQYQSDSRTVDDHSTESVGGIKTIEAMGALKLLTGGTASLAAIDDLGLSTGRDLNQVVGQRLNLTVGGQLLERVQGARRSIANTTWIGSEGVNVLQVLCDLIDLVVLMNTDLAGHTHGPSPAPSNAGAFAGHAANGELLSGQLKPITGV